MRRSQKLFSRVNSCEYVSHVTTTRVNCDVAIFTVCWQWVAFLVTSYIRSYRILCSECKMLFNKKVPHRMHCNSQSMKWTKHFYFTSYSTTFLLSETFATKFCFRIMFFFHADILVFPAKCVALKKNYL